ncbi:MAG: hypothetical protein MPW15_09135 [Candidatus Manganitrophus sp.]|nr:hypothetical protein [Candidatus Manganitrophus sp.]
MVVRLFYIAVLLALMTILPFLPAAGISSAEETPTLAKAPKRKEMKEVRGKIVKIDPVTQRIRVVPGIFSRAQEVRITARTEITIHGRPATFQRAAAGR